MSWATFRLAAPANCRFANVAGLMHTAGIAPAALLGGMTGFCVAQALTAREFLARYLDEHLERVWELGLPWHTLQVDTDATASSLAAAIQAFEPRQAEGVLIGLSMPMTRVAHRSDIGHALYAGTGTHHYVLRCVHAPGTVTTIDATPTRETPEPFVRERTDTLESLLGGDPFELFLDRPWDVISGIRVRRRAPGDRLGDAVSALRADLRARADDAAPTLAWVARRWAAVDDHGDDYFSAHFNVFKVIAEHRAFLPDLIRAATNERPESAKVLAELAAIQDRYHLLAMLSFKLQFTKSREHRRKLVAGGEEVLEALLASERAWARATLGTMT